MEVQVPRLPFSFDPLIAEAKRRMHRRRLFILVLALLTGGGAAGASVALNSSSAVQTAAACPAPAAYYAYALPQDPPHPPAPGASATSWGWTPRKHPVKIGDRMRANGHLWEVTKIAAMPGVEPVCRPFGIIGWSGTGSMVLGGRLVLRPVS